MYFLHEENELLKKQLVQEEGKLSFKQIGGADSLVSQYTGLPSAEHFSVLASLLKRFKLNYFSGWNVEVLGHEDKLLCTLMKLRLNLHYFDLAFRFKTSTATIHNIVMTYIYAMHEVLFVGVMNKIPSKCKNAMFLPTCFRDFSNCRIILDCTEIEVAIPESLKLKKVTYSHYKQRHTFKVLIGIAPNATITFVSDLFPGSVSDKEITRKSGILNHMVAGDLILADKGFLITDMCRELGVTVNIPPFLVQTQFTVQEALATRKIARARIHVERAISRLKKFKILDFIMPQMREHSSVIVQTCAALVNLQYSLLKENEQCFGALTE